MPWTRSRFTIKILTPTSRSIFIQTCNYEGKVYLRNRVEDSKGASVLLLGRKHVGRCRCNCGLRCVQAFPYVSTV